MPETLTSRERILKALNHDVLEALFDTVLEITLRIAERELELLGTEVDVVRCGDDLGGQTGLQISYDHYARFIKPRHVKFFRKVKELNCIRFYISNQV
jgi:hypothetical protein